MKSKMWPSTKILIKYVTTAGESKMRFLHDTELTRSTGENICNSIAEIVQSKGIDLQSCTGLTSNGAACFTRKNLCAGKLLKDKIRKLAVAIHCHDHRLALACRDAFTSVPQLDKMSEGLDALYRYYETSTVTSASLRSLQDI